MRCKKHQHLIAPINHIAAVEKPLLDLVAHILTQAANPVCHLQIQHGHPGPKYHVHANVDQKGKRPYLSLITASLEYSVALSAAIALGPNTNGFDMKNRYI
jgi:hypothetical protein